MNSARVIWEWWVVRQDSCKKYTRIALIKCATHHTVEQLAGGLRHRRGVGRQLGRHRLLVAHGRVLVEQHPVEHRHRPREVSHLEAEME